MGLVCHLLSLIEILLKHDSVTLVLQLVEFALVDDFGWTAVGQMRGVPHVGFSTALLRTVSLLNLVHLELQEVIVAHCGMGLS